MQPTDRSEKRWNDWHRQVWMLFGMLLLIQPGCSWLTQAFYRGQAPPQVFNQQATQEQIISVVNANSQAIQSMQAKVQVRATGTPTLSGDLAVEQPSRLRMQVGLLGMTSSGLDLGSNDNEFWVWIKSALPGGQPPAVLYATHQEYERSAMKQALPIEPAWIIDSLGLAYFDPRAQHEGPFPRPDGSLEIRSTFQTSTGPMTKSTMVDPLRGVVVAQELYRGSTRIAACRASKHQYFEDINASIPRLVEIEVGLGTQQPGQVTIELSNILPNSIDATYAGMWQMPRPKNIEMINIAERMAQPGLMPGNPAAANPAAAGLPAPATPGPGGFPPANPTLGNGFPASDPPAFGSPTRQPIGSGLGGNNGTSPATARPPLTPGGVSSAAGTTPRAYPNHPGGGAFAYPSSPPQSAPPQSAPPQSARPAEFQESGINEDYLPRGFQRN